MGVTTGQHSLSNLVDLDNGLISREVFVNKEIYQQEQEQIFARAWLFIGHESQIPNPGDYFVSCMGEESVILVRDQQQKIHVFLNTCRHRGMKVCRYDKGNTVQFTCPFHGWSYDTEGKLAGVPRFKEGYQERMDRSQWGLIEVAQLENYRGSIWATWDKDAPPFSDYLGDFKIYLATLFDCFDGKEGGAQVLDGVQKWRLPCNWKFPATSFGGDAAHEYSHRSTHVAAYGPQGKGDRHGVARPGEKRLEVSIPGLGHGAHITVYEADAPYMPTWGSLQRVDDYFKRAYEKQRECLPTPLRMDVGAATFFPNASYSAGIRRTIVIWHPRGPEMTEAWRFYLVDKDTPQEVRDAIRRYLMRYSGPVGMTEQDDMENWNYAYAASKGTIARRYPYNYQMGVGNNPLDVPIPGRVTQVLSEENQRSRFRRWTEFMHATGWDEIYPKNGKKADEYHGR